MFLQFHARNIFLNPGYGIKLRRNSQPRVYLSCCAVVRSDPKPWEQRRSETYSIIRAFLPLRTPRPYDNVAWLRRMTPKERILHATAMAYVTGIQPGFLRRIARVCDVEDRDFPRQKHCAFEPGNLIVAGTEKMPILSL